MMLQGLSNYLPKSVTEERQKGPIETREEIGTIGPTTEIKIKKQIKEKGPQKQMKAETAKAEVTAEAVATSARTVRREKGNQSNPKTNPLPQTLPTVLQKTKGLKKNITAHQKAEAEKASLEEDEIKEETKTHQQIKVKISLVVGRGSATNGQ